MNAHTYLFQPGLWKAKGHFWDAEGRIIPMEGESRIEHGPDGWTIQGRLCLLGHQFEYVNDYRLEPAAPEMRHIPWTSLNPALGFLKGHFIVVADAILSSFHSEDGRHHGSETLLLQEPTLYHARGMLLKGEELVSSWSAALQRVL